MLVLQPIPAATPPLKLVAFRLLVSFLLPSAPSIHCRSLIFRWTRVFDVQARQSQLGRRMSRAGVIKATSSIDSDSFWASPRVMRCSCPRPHHRGGASHLGTPA